jgi:hypothetical protein
LKTTEEAVTQRGMWESSHWMLVPLLTGSQVGVSPWMTWLDQATWLVSRWSPTNIKVDPTYHVHQPPASCHNVRWRLEFPSWGWDRWSEALDLRVQSFTTFWAPLIFLGICRLQDFLGGTLHSWARLACLPLWRLTF